LNESEQSIHKDYNNIRFTVITEDKKKKIDGHLYCRFGYDTRQKLLLVYI